MPIKTFGDRNNKFVTVIVPDHKTVVKVFTDFAFDIVKYPAYGFTTIYASSSGEDILSRSFNTCTPNGAKDAIEFLVLKLSTLTQEEPSGSNLAVS